MNIIFSSILKTNLFQSIKGPCSYILGTTRLNLTPKRFLYAKTSLGLDGYLMQRERTLQQLANIAGKFREKMREYTLPDSTSMIFTEDLKNMVHMAETTDVDLIKLMMKKFNSQNQELRFGSFIFGPVIMRMFHHLNTPDAALECFLDASFGSFFDQAASYLVLLDLLFINDRYDDILLAYDTIRKRQVGGKLGAPPRHVVVLSMAACYRIRTEAALERALDMWRECSAAASPPMRRAATFLAALCVMQSRPQVALEIVSSCNNQNYTTVRNIKALALCQIGRKDDALLVLRSVFGQDDYSVGKHTFNRDVITQIDESFKTETSSELSEQYAHVRKQLDSNELITNTTLEEQLCSEIVTSAFPKQNINQNRQYEQRDSQYKRQSFNNFPQRNRNNRPGLYEMQ